MDIEKKARLELIAKLSVGFRCAEEVSLDLRGEKLRCDVLARPIEQQFERYLFAFEVKRPSKEWHYTKWARTIKQTIDYCGATVLDSWQNVAKVGAQVTASFVYPAPHSIPSVDDVRETDLVRDGFENSVAGMFHLAMMFRTGRAGPINMTNISYFGLTLGPRPIWDERTGFHSSSHQLLNNKRPIGSVNR